MPAQNAEPKLRLKDGTEIDGRRAYTLWKYLVGMEQGRPLHLTTLLSLAHDRSHAVSPELIAQIRHQDPAFISPEGTLDPLACRVLLNACQDTREGRVLVNPFELRTKGDIEAYQRVERRLSTFLERLSRGTDEDGPAIA